MDVLGILGVGDLTDKLVRGLRRSGYNGTILLSPRNAARASALAIECDCRVLPSNQAVVDESAVVVVAVRPSALGELASQVKFRNGQHLVSLLAGTSLDQLSEAFPGARCTRAMLSYAAMFNQTTVVVCPPTPAVEPWLTPLGRTVVLDDEASFELATVAACMNGWFFYLLHDLQQWLSEKGLKPDAARTLVLSNLQDCIASAEQQPGQSLSDLGQRIATPGTFTYAGLEVLMQQRSSAMWGNACEAVLEALLARTEVNRSDLDPSNAKRL